MKFNTIFLQSKRLLLTALLVCTASVSQNLESTSKKMYLGEWKQSISNQIMPRFFENVDVDDSLRQTSLFSSSLIPISSFSTSGLNTKQYNFFNSQAIALLDSTSIFAFTLRTQFDEISDSKYNSVNIPLGVGFTNQNLKGTNPQLLSQYTYSSGYEYSYGGLSLGLAAVFVQQNYADANFGFITFDSQKSSAIYNDPILQETSRGLGYSLNFSQILPYSLKLALDYQAKIDMHEFGSLGKSYIQTGDFDIPENYSVSLNVPVLNKDNIKFTAKEIGYSDIKATLHDGFSPEFLRLMNSPVRPSFEWDDLAVYTIEYQKKFQNTQALSLGIASSQQAKTFSPTLNQILDSDTASISYKMSFESRLAGGKIDVFATYGDKPIFIGRTDFGRFLPDNIDAHVEAGFTWNRSF